MTHPRIAIYDDYLPFHMGSEIKREIVDDPIDWQEFINEPRFVSNDANCDEYRLEDERAVNEIHRILRYETCPLCRTHMSEVSPGDIQKIFVCLTCGFWGGRGNRFDHIYMHESLLRGVIGCYAKTSPLSIAASEYLITHLKKHPNDLSKISPRRAEKFVLDLLKDYLDAEIKPIGGTRDKGVDGYVVKGNEISTLIQVKWREDMNKAESVSVVREVAGTLLARNIPSGIIISNRNHFSKDAKDDSKKISQLDISGLGKLELQLMDYHTILDMLEISNKKMTDGMGIEDWFIHETDHVFDGAMRISREIVDKFK